MRTLKGSDLVALEREILLRGSIVDLARLAWHLVEQAKPFVGNWHIDAMAEMLTALYLRQIDNLRVSIPPGFMKSLMTSVFFPSWVWLRSPGDRFMTASFDGTLTARDSQRCIDIYESDWWKARVPEFKLKREGGRAPGKKLFHNEFGGWRMATSIGGKATGNHTDWLVVDDPTKPKGLTAVRLAEAENWWKGTASTRLTRPGKGRLLTMQRLHEKDLCGYVEQDPSFFHLVLPAHYNPSHPFVYGKDLRRVKGELLWPEYRDEEALAKLARDLDGDREAQLEQNPRDDATRIFPLSFFDPDKRWTDADLPDEGFDSTLISVDATFKDKPDSDDVAIAVVSTKGPKRYLRKLFYGKLGFTALVLTFKRICEEFPEATAKLIEDKANGSALMDVLKKEVPGLVAVEPVGSKIARAHACTLEMQTGFFLTPADEDAHSYMPFLIDQFTNFPLGKNDDAVDAVTQALNWLRMHSVNTVQQLLDAKREEERGRFEASQNAKLAPSNPLAAMLKQG